MLAVEPGITVSVSEYMREVRRFREFKRLVGHPVVPRKVGILWSAWGRAMSLWRWTREPRYLEEARRLRARIRRVEREWLEARMYFKRKIKKPFWRIDVAYQFEKETREPPYRFFCEFRKYLYTKKPEAYAEWEPITKEYRLRPEFEAQAEGELRLIMFASSLLSRVRKDLTVAHVGWVEVLTKIKVFPFPNIEIAPVSKAEVDASLDTEQYYVRFEETGVIKGEYTTTEVLGWLRHYRRWLERATEARIIRRPKAWERMVRQTSLDEFVERIREIRERMRRR